MKSKGIGILAEAFVNIAELLARSVIKKDGNTVRVRSGCKDRPERAGVPWSRLLAHSVQL